MVCSSSFLLPGYPTFLNGHMDSPLHVCHRPFPSLCAFMKSLYSLFPLYCPTRKVVRLGWRAARNVLRSRPRRLDHNHVQQVCPPYPPTFILNNADPSLLFLAPSRLRSQLFFSFDASMCPF